MKKMPDVDGVAPSSHGSMQLSWLGETLDSYEVEELDGHDLAKLLLPQLAVRMEEKKNPPV